MGLIAPSATLIARACASLVFTSSWRAMNSGLPPSRMSVPRPAMFVAIVTIPRRPACATISASRSWNLAFSTTCFTPFLCKIPDSRSDFSIDVVPTSTGCPFPCSSAILSATALYFSFSVRNTTSDFRGAASACSSESRRSRACRSFQTRLPRSPPFPSCRSAS